MATEPEITDRRVLRGVRTRDAILTAVIELVEGGELAPTADQIADRAGVARRSLYHHFEDLDDLAGAVSMHHLNSYMDLIKPLPRSGAFRDRLSSFVDQRAALAEKLMPVYRSSLLIAPHSSAVGAHLEFASEFLRAEVTQAFEPELGAGASWELDAIDAVASLDGWVRLRVNQRLSPAESERVLGQSITALLAGRRNGPDPD